MARINAKLNLNKIPQDADNNSLIFAENIQVDKNGSIIKEYGLSLVDIMSSDVFTYSNLDEYAKIYFDKIIPILKRWEGSYEILGAISNNNYIYIFFQAVSSNHEVYHAIIEYDETKNESKFCNCNWSYSGGIITGNVIINTRNETILTISEYFEDDVKLIPLKVINLKYSSYNDDEYIYCLNSGVSFTRLTLKGYCKHSIENGIYTFYIRYKIHDDYYSNWFPCSADVYGGTKSNVKRTQVSYLQGININLNSSNSFIFSVNYDKILLPYDEYQLGFRLKCEAGTKYRIWKTFKRPIGTIYFTPNEEELEEADNKDFSSTSVNLYNVKNILSFKNRQYVSNYIENDYNPKEDIVKRAVNNIDVSLNFKPSFVSEEASVGPSSIYEYENEKLNVIAWELVNTFDRIGLTNIVRNNLLDRINSYIYVTRNTAFEYFQNHAEGEIDYLFTNANTGRFPLSPDTFIFEGEANKIELEPGKTQWYLYDRYADAEQFIIDNTDSGFTTLHQVYNSVYNPSEYGADMCNIFIRLNYTGMSEDTKWGWIYNGNDGGVGYSLDNLGVLNDIQYFDTENKRFILSNGEVLNSISVKHIYFVNEYYENITHIYAYEVNYTITINGDNYKTEVINRNNDNSNTITLLPFQMYKFFIHFIRRNGEITNGYPIKNKTTGNYYFGYYPNKDELIDDTTNTIVTSGTPGTNNISYVLADHHIIYPSFSNIDLDLIDSETSEYVGYFISYCHVKDKIIELKSAKYKHYIGAQEHNINALYYVSPDLDMLLETIIDAKVTFVTPTEVIKELEVNKGDSEHPINFNVIYNYYPSDDPGNLNTFGDIGLLAAELENATDNYSIEYTDNDDISKQIVNYLNDPSSDDLAEEINRIFTYIHLEYEADEENLTLIRCTPYIYKNNVPNYDDYTIYGYISRIFKPTFFNNGLRVYANSGDVYEKNVNNMNLYQGFYIKVTLNEELIRTIPPSFKNYIYSNYNLNYISIDDGKLLSATKDVTENNTTNTYLVNYINSQDVSNIYKLEEYYKNAPDIIYQKYDNSKIIKFDNVIRRSTIVGEGERNFKFEADDYCIIPNHKGVIIKLVLTNNELLIHTEAALFLFNTSNMFTSNDNYEVQVKEADIFDTGIKEVFTSDRGFAGISNKKHSILAFGNYVFYNSKSKYIYNYNTNSINEISKDIIWLIDNYVEDIIFSFEPTYEKLLLLFTLKDDSNLLLSYSLRYNNFISVIDFRYDESITTDSICYFKYNNNYYKFDKNSTNYLSLYNTNDLYPTYYLNRSGEDYNTPCSVIDIIFNDNYEIVKELNFIEWTCSKIQNYISDTNQTEDNIAIDGSIDTPVSLANTVNETVDSETQVKVLHTKISSILKNFGFTAEEHLERDYPGDYLIIFTDSTYSGVLKLSKTDNNGSQILPKITDADYYRYPKFNNGIWNFNWFKNVYNINDIYKYYEHNDILNFFRTKGYTHSNNQSTIYGKYIVARFIFDRHNNFKVENIKFNTNTKL